MRSVQLQQVVQFAKEMKGQCLTEGCPELQVIQVALQCKKGHVWRADAKTVLSGKWCPKCQNTNRKLTIEEMRKIAKERGGVCLSKKYVNAETRLHWQCAKKHKWWTNPHTVKRGTWCPTCKNENQKNTIEDMHRLASKKKGFCLSKRYIDNATPLKWKCSEGHTWKNQPSNITMGQWCPQCAIENRRLSLEDLKKMAKERGGKCLSESYRGNNQKLLWECQEGHQWKATAVNVRNNETWCPYCSQNVKHTMKDMRRLASEKGGKCLSHRYENNKVPLTWKCSEGHVWENAATHIISGQWCPECAGVKKLTIEKMKEYAEKNRGFCLSKEYINTKIKLDWKCEKGHVWSATPKEIYSKKRWSCPVCRQNRGSQSKKAA